MVAEDDVSDLVRQDEQEPGRLLLVLADHDDRAAVDSRGQAVHTPKRSGEASDVKYRGSVSPAVVEERLEIDPGPPLLEDLLSNLASRSAELCGARARLCARLAGRERKGAQVAAFQRS